MKKTFIVMMMVMALALSTMAGAIAKNGNAPGHENENAAVKVSDYDSRLNQPGTMDFLGNKSGFHLWFTVEAGSIAASNPNYTVGNSYHNVYKWADQIGDVNPAEWCNNGVAISIPDLEPYNLGGMDGARLAYYKIWDVTYDAWVCGSDG